MKVAFIGAGGMCREHAKAFSDIPGVSLVGVTSRTAESARIFAQEFDLPVQAGNPAELHEKTGADLVIMAVPDDQAMAVGLEALKSPWAVFMEKPPGLDCNETARLLEASCGRSRPVYVGLNRRHIGATLEVLAGLTKSGGRRHIHVQDQQDLADAATYGFTRRILDQWMFANCIHLLDYLPALARGNPCEVRVNQEWDPADPRVVSAFVRYDSGDTALYEALWNRPGPWAVSVTDDENRWELRPLEHAQQQVRGSRAWEELPTHPWDEGFKPGFRRQAEEVVKGLRDEPSTAVTLEEASRSMKLVNDIYFPHGPVTS